MQVLEIDIFAIGDFVKFKNNVHMEIRRLVA